MFCPDNGLYTKFGHFIGGLYGGSKISLVWRGTLVISPFGAGLSELNVKNQVVNIIDFVGHVFSLIASYAALLL